jgi:protein-disulfide isomerase
MAKKNMTRKPASGNTQAKTQPKKSAVKPIAILAIGVAAALGIAMFLSGGEPEPTTTLSDAPIPIDYAGGGQTRGAENPAVTLVEYGDYECPHCADFHVVVSELMRRMPNELALEYHHYPLPVGPNSMTASLAAEAAGEQGRYWEMHDRIFETQRQWSGRPDGVEIFASMAGQLGLDTERFRQDLQSEEIQTRVLSDRLRGNALQISGTPTFFINGRRLDYLPSSVDEFEAIIRSQMAQ